jgi:GTP pyrophosphokinase/guanosine-3',5'-bis(diphosphate) 3'-pyrophosphohydrolase
MFYLELRDIAHLHSLMLTLEAESEVAEIVRYRDMKSKNAQTPVTSV